MSKWLVTIWTITIAFTTFGQSLTGTVKSEEGKPLSGALVFIEETSLNTTTNHQGVFRLDGLPMGMTKVVIVAEGFTTTLKDVMVKEGSVQLDFEMKPLIQNLLEVEVTDTKIQDLSESWLLSVSGSGIYEAKKSELIQLDELIGNKAANVSRQVYSKVPGLNIWENDGAGVQLGIGGRGLNPNRTSNFNVRQNGYDISADALGYPESYYTPPVQALDRIEIVRGAAGLQYGTQFGGMLNFKFKEGSKEEKADVDLVQTVGSFGLFNTFNSVGGTIGKMQYYGFVQYKRSNGWRPNSGIEQKTAYASLRYHFNPFLSLKVEHTHMDYLAQQPGGLTDVEFLQNPRQSNRERNWFDVDWDLSAVELDYRLSPSWKINNKTFILSAHRYALGNLDRIDRPDDPESNRNLIMGQYQNWGNEFRAIHNYSLFGNGAVLLIGNRYYHGQTDQSQGEAVSGFDADFDYIDEGDPNQSDFNFPSRNISFFVENIFNLTPRLSVTPGLRYEHIRTDADGHYFVRTTDLAGNILTEQQVPENRRKNRSFVIAGLGVSFKPNEILEVYSNFSQNFRAINFNDIRVNNSSLVVDENINDERGFNFDLGIRGNRIKNFRYDVSMFWLSYKDRISTIPGQVIDPRFPGLDVPMTVRFRTNVGNARIVGLEAYGELDVWRWINPTDRKSSMNIFANVAVISSEYTSSKRETLVGKEVELVPTLNLKTGLSYKYKSFGASLLYSYVSEQFSDAQNSPTSPTAIFGTIPSYYVADASFSYKLNNWTIETGINNLTDNKYFTRRADGYPGPGIIPSDGRSFYLTVGVNF
ncbi:MAG: TonB-dependent receptor [Cyclobacteriaceae bacterium]|nr:TonB-dependent receptor [Cyclobacteriaceae bacterium HetDA_MAG_MS6]